MGIIRRCKRNSGLHCKRAKKKIKGYNPNHSKYAELLKLCGHQKENVRGIANENLKGTCTKTLLPEMPWVHSDA